MENMSELPLLITAISEIEDGLKKAYDAARAYAELEVVNSSLTDKALAGHMGISPAYFCDLMKRRRKWSLELLSKLQKALESKQVPKL